MRNVVRTVMIVAVVAAVIVVLLPQRTRSQSASFEAGRFPGTEHPDITGVWQAMNSANWDLEDHSAEAGPSVQLIGAWGAQPAGIGVVEGGEIPYKPEALEKKKQNLANRTVVDPDDLNGSGDPEAKCYMPGVPRATYLPHPFQIFQSEDRIFIAYSFASARRTIPLDGGEESPIDFWMGWSNGRWEGDTLVVDTTGFNGLAWFDRAGNYASSALHVTERFTPSSASHMMYEAAIEDPTVFTRPWKISMPLYRRMEENARLLEFKCIEFVEDYIYGSLRKNPTE